MIGLFIIYPAVYSAGLSLTNASLARAQWDFVGLRNFVDFFTDPTVRQVLKNTYYYVFVVIAFQFLFGLGTALALKSVRRGRGLYGAILFLPWVLSDIIAVSAWKRLFHDSYGLLNYFLGIIGLGHPKWLASPSLAIITCMILNIWKGYPFSMVWELAGLQSIPDELYEAAKVDGASGMQSFLHITIPMMSYTMLANIMLITIYTFNIFALIYALTGGGPLNYTEIIGLHMYRAAFESGRLGYGASVSVMMFVLNLIITLAYIRVIARRGILEER
jgi:multiple sugar transport system permease protein